MAEYSSYNILISCSQFGLPVICLFWPV